MRWLWLLVLCGCSGSSAGSSDDADAGPNDRFCLPRIGSYVATPVRLVGTCGDLPAKTLTERDANHATTGAACQGEPHGSSDGCSVIVDTQCTAADGSLLEVLGYIEWTKDATRGDGRYLMQQHDANGVPLCQGEYTVTWSRPAK